MAVAAAVGVATSSLSASHSAAVDILVLDLGNSRAVDRALVASGVPARSLASNPATPLLPGGLKALERVQHDVALRLSIPRSRVASAVRVIDSAVTPAFDYDRTPGRRLTVEARASGRAPARRLAAAFATAYADQRARFYREQARAARFPSDRGGSLSQAALGAQLEQDRLELLGASSTIPAASSPQPTRNALVAVLICLGINALVLRRRMRPRA